MEVMPGMLLSRVFLAVILISFAKTDAANLTVSPLCNGKNIVAPSGDWAWDQGSRGPWPSCSAPTPVNLGQMCEGDATSIVMRADGSPQCLVAEMLECAFNMHAVSQIDFDVTIWNCKGTWVAPLWLDPDYWNGGGASGELDLVEMCPKELVRTNFANGGYPKSWPFDGDFARAHLTMWNSNGDVTVKMCGDYGGDSCDGDGAAFYPQVYDSNACHGHNCQFHLVSDIWNGVRGDGGYSYCAGGWNPNSACSYSVENIKIQAAPGTFGGKCAVLTGGKPSPAPPPPPPAPPSPPPSASCQAHDSVHCNGGGWCAGNQCCPDGSICPSADEDWNQCRAGKGYDCLQPGPSPSPPPSPPPAPPPPPPPAPPAPSAGTCSKMLSSKNWCGSCAKESECGCDGHGQACCWSAPDPKCNNAAASEMDLIV